MSDIILNLVIVLEDNLLLFGCVQVCLFYHYYALDWFKSIFILDKSIDLFIFYKFGIIIVTYINNSIYLRF